MPSDKDAPAMPEIPCWRLQMLGGFRATSLRTSDNDVVEQFRTHKTALLLARLALFPHRAHAREMLADLLWPDAPADRGRASLSQTLVYLRAALHQPRTGGFLVADHKTVRIVTGALQTDVAEWEVLAAHALASSSDRDEQITQIRAVLAAFTGELLPGFYDDWVCDERNRLAGLYSQLEDRLQLLEAEVTQDAFAIPQAKISNGLGDTYPPLLNAPLFLTRFFGREAECTKALELLGQLPAVRLITLLGMGGIGKTRLAVQIAQAVVNPGCVQDDAVCFDWALFVPLEQARTREHMEGILLSAMNLEKQKGDGLAAIVTYLNAMLATRAKTGNGRLLLILDNLEQLEAAAAPLIVYLLAQVSGLTIVTTSRQPVGIAGEQEITIGPMGGVTKEKVEPPDDVQLFVDRARLARSTFALTSENREAVTRLCSLLEGVPLALELAAAWIRVLTPQQITERLSRRFEVLAQRGASTSTSRNLSSKRHQSLRAAIAWSYDLLEPSLQVFWRQLSVFRSGWTADAAQVVTGVEDVSGPLLLLAERSLIVAEADEATGDVRYRMLESLREFAQEQSEPDEQNDVRLGHATFYEALSQRADHIEADCGHRPALALIGAERDNIRAAFQFALKPSEELAKDSDAARVVGTRLALQTCWLWSLREQADILEQAATCVATLPEKAGLPLQAQILDRQGHLMMLLGDYVSAKQKLNESLALSDRLGNPRESCTTKRRLAGVAWFLHNTEEALALLTDCLRFVQKDNDPVTEAKLFNMMAVCGEGKAERWEWMTQAIALFREHAPHSFYYASALNNMGTIALQTSDLKTARWSLEEAHKLAVADGSPGMLGVAKLTLTRLFLTTGESLDRAASLLQEAQSLFEECCEPPRVAQTLHFKFELALKCGDVDTAVCHARECLQILHDGIADSAAKQAEVKAEMAQALSDAGYQSQVLRIM